MYTVRTWLNVGFAGFAEKPIVQLAAKYQTISEGTALTLRCSVMRGKPQVRLHWLHNGANVTANPRTGVSINGKSVVCKL